MRLLLLGSTALARDPSKLSVHHERVHPIAGSPTDPAAILTALQGQDAVLCALGPSSPKEILSSHLMRATVDALIPSMKTQRVNRIVMLSALGAGQSASQAPAAFRLMFGTLFRQVGNDKAAAEAVLEQSDLDWTVVYAPSLTDGARTGNYKHGQALELRGMPRISRADVAEFMLAQLTDPRYSRKPAIIST
jgi:putative NADH-flavin reductase